MQEEFKFYQEDAGSSLVVVGASGNEGAEAAGVAPAIGVTLDFGSGEPSLRLAPRAGGFAPRTAPAGEALADPPRAEDVALFLHTSGTTSRPKGVPLTHANLAASLDNIRQVGRGGGWVGMGLRPAGVMKWWGPSVVGWSVKGCGCPTAAFRAGASGAQACMHACRLPVPSSLRGHACS